ncbi:MAG: TetR/AcrR family transcriptional regulator [Caldimicrobium sp.]
MSNTKVSKTKEKLLKAALELFSEKGYLGATTKEIAKRASVSEPTLFRHFKNKNNLFIAVLEHYSFLPKLRELIKELENKPLKEALKDIAQAFITQLNSKKALIRIMLAESSRYPEDIQKAYQKTIFQVHKELAQYFEHYQKEGALKRIPPIILSQAFLGLLFSYFLLKEFKRLNPYKDLSDDDIIKNYVKLILNNG